jgi:hypothetical protein
MTTRRDSSGLEVFRERRKDAFGVKFQPYCFHFNMEPIQVDEGHAPEGGLLLLLDKCGYDA